MYVYQIGTLGVQSQNIEMSFNIISTLGLALGRAININDENL